MRVRGGQCVQGRVYVGRRIAVLVVVGSVALTLTYGCSPIVVYNTSGTELFIVR